MIRGHAEQLRDVFARSLFEQTQGHDRALDLAELGDASAESNDVFGARDELFLKNELGVEKLVRRELVVRAGAKVPAPLIARGVAHDGDEHRRRVGRGFDSSGLHEIEQRTQRVLHAIDRFFRLEAFVTRHGRERAALGREHAREALEHVLAGGREGLGVEGS